MGKKSLFKAKGKKAEAAEDAAKKPAGKAARTAGKKGGKGKGRGGRIAGKLASMTVPAIIGLIAVTVVFAYVATDIMKTDKEVYIDEINDMATSLITEDRNLYQAELARQDVYFLQGDATAEDAVASAQEEFKTSMTEVKQGITALQKKFSKDRYFFKSFKASGQEKSNEELLQDFAVGVQSWRVAYDVQTFTGNNEKAYAAFGTARDSLGKLEESVSAYTDYRVAQQRKKIASLIGIIIAVIGVLIVIILIRTVRLLRYVTRSIVAVDRDISTIAAQDLSVPVTVNKANDELGSLSNAAMEMQQKLSAVIGTIDQSSKELATAGSTMATQTDVATESVRNISDAIEQMARTASDQASNVQNIASNMDELMGMVNDSAAASAELKTESDNIDKVTSEGMDTVSELTRVTAESLESFNQIFSLMDAIATNAEHIGAASNLISDIASQTNLLSLNASIEAARAGEAGKGFAVVADEIRSLAEQSAGSVDTINKMLSDLRGAIDSAQTQSEKVKEFVNAQSSSVSDTKDRFDSIVEAVRHINEEIDRISETNIRMKSGFDEVTGLVSNLSASAEQNAASSEEISATSSQVSGNISDMNESVQEVSSSSQKLVELVGGFKL